MGLKRAKTARPRPEPFGARDRDNESEGFQRKH